MLDWVRVLVDPTRLAGPRGSGTDHDLAPTGLTTCCILRKWDAAHDDDFRCLDGRRNGGDCYNTYIPDLDTAGEERARRRRHVTFGL